MISDSNQIAYVCVCRGTTVLADFSSGGADLETLAQQCLEITPRFHCSYSHTLRERMYCFLMDDRFVYFTIVEERLGKMQAYRFLERVKTSFLSFLKSTPVEDLDRLNSRCFQEEFSPVFRFLMRLSGDCDRTGNADSKSGKNAPITPNLSFGRLNELEWKTRGVPNGEEIGNFPVADDLVVDSDAIRERSLSLSPRKNGFACGIEEEGGKRLQARRNWQKKVWIVLLVDLVVCCILFAVWLNICKGFSCFKS